MWQEWRVDLDFPGWSSTISGCLSKLLSDLESTAATPLLLRSPVSLGDLSPSFSTTSASPLLLWRASEAWGTSSAARHHNTQNNACKSNNDWEKLDTKWKTAQLHNLSQWRMKGKNYQISRICLCGSDLFLEHQGHLAQTCFCSCYHFQYLKDCPSPLWWEKIEC